MKYFPDPLEHIVGFVCSDKRRSPNPSPTKFINTTTSYLSDVSNLDVSSEEVKTNVCEPKAERSNLYPNDNLGLQAPPLEVSSPTRTNKRPLLRTSVKIVPTVSPKRTTPTTILNDKMFQNIEYSLSRIRGALKYRPDPIAERPSYTDRRSGSRSPTFRPSLTDRPSRSPQRYSTTPTTSSIN